MDKRFYDAYQWIHQDPVSGEFRVQMGKETPFRKDLFKAVQNFGIDRDQYKISDRGLAREFHEALLEIAEANGTDLSEHEFNHRFRSKRGDLFSSWLGSAPSSYSLVFPIMIRSHNFPDQVELYESKAQQIDDSRWDDFLSAAKSAEDSNFRSFLDELPNDYSDDPLQRREWTYLKINIDARDEFYAIYRVSELIELRFAEINFFDNLWGAGMPQPASSDRPPNEKWSTLQEPPFYLVFRDGNFVTYRGMDFDYRRSIGILHFSQADVDQISEVPIFDYNAGNGTFEGNLVSALLAYQDGITERSVRQSFFSFWRGIEILSKTSNFGEMVDRGKFTISYQRDGFGSMRPSLKEAIDEIEDIRHELVHEGLKTEVHRGHRNGAKLLLDGLLLLYIENYDDWDLDDMASFLKHGVDYQDKIQFITTLLRDLS